MRLSQIRTIEALLSEYGRWAYQSRGLSLYYPSIEPHERLRSKMSASANITDDEALAVDKVIAAMKAIRPDQHEALTLFYIAGMSYREIGREKHIHHRSASDLVQGGRMWIEGALLTVAPFSAED